MQHDYYLMLLKSYHLKYIIICVFLEDEFFEFSQLVPIQDRNRKVKAWYGGLGFRDIQGFNLALLGKQCWSLLNRPTALVTRVLKARYYPNCHFLQAQRTGGASFTWSGIWQAKEEIKKRLRWVLGDGKTINIDKDRWLKAKEGYCVDSSDMTNQLALRKVCEFF